ncbi:conserved hypothetical protein [Ricinus communis]|uniref:Uncharacterized protein n=1 Tax=Ricinus communis TaxID=3988 RepID=B9RZB5_RICCO|nr:conserved hypothetical protein [Ricinus communis]
MQHKWQQQRLQILLQGLANKCMPFPFKCHWRTSERDASLGKDCHIRQRWIMCLTNQDTR